MAVFVVGRVVLPLVKNVVEKAVLWMVVREL